MNSRRRWLKWPDSFSGQLLLLLFGGILLLQGANFITVCSVQRMYVRQAEKTRAEHLAALWLIFDGLDSARRRALVQRLDDSGRPEKLREAVKLLPERPGRQDTSDDVLRLLDMLSESFGSSQLRPTGVEARIRDGQDGIFPLHLPMLETAVRLSDGTWLEIVQPFNVDDRNVVWTQRFFVLVEALVICVLSALALARMTRPLRELGDAAEAFGHHPETSLPLPEKGVREIREAACSFNLMRERICGNLLERDRMLAAMAHDLRTPLTRLRLRLAAVEPPCLRGKLEQNVADMRDIISQGLELAKSLFTDESFVTVDIGAFIQSLADDCADVGKPVFLHSDALNSSGQVLVNARPVCLKRCLENLVDNACAYGKQAEINLVRTNDAIRVEIADAGPGIPEDMLAKVFTPFFRLETSRSRKSGGSGLGLAIAKNMALLNKGKITLQNLPQGGLLAALILPPATDGTGKI